MSDATWTPLDIIQAVIDALSHPVNWRQGSQLVSNDGTLSLDEAVSLFDSERCLEHRILIAADQMGLSEFKTILQLNDGLESHEVLMSMLQRVKHTIEQESLQAEDVDDEVFIDPDFKMTGSKRPVPLVALLCVAAMFIVWASKGFPVSGLTAWSAIFVAQ